MIARTLSCLAVATVCALGGGNPTLAAGHTVAPAKVLYQATWARSMGAWSSSGTGWTTGAGALAYGGKDTATLVAPYRVSRPSYALEASIRLLTWKHSDLSDSSAFGILLRATGVANPASSSTSGLIAGVARGFSGCDGLYSWAVIATAETDMEVFKENSTFKPGSGWHLYRVEVRGNSFKLLVDGRVRNAATSKLFAGGTRVGLFSLAGQIQVRSFKVLGW